MFLNLGLLGKYQQTLYNVHANTYTTVCEECPKQREDKEDEDGHPPLAQPTTN